MDARERRVANKEMSAIVYFIFKETMSFFQNKAFKPSFKKLYQAVLFATNSFVVVNKKVRKQENKKSTKKAIKKTKKKKEENKNSTKKVIKKKRKFFLFFLGLFLGRVLVFFLVFLFS